MITAPQLLTRIRIPGARLAFLSTLTTLTVVGGLSLAARAQAPVPITAAPAPNNCPVPPTLPPQGSAMDYVVRFQMLHRAGGKQASASSEIDVIAGQPTPWVAVGSDIDDPVVMRRGQRVCFLASPIDADHAVLSISYEVAEPTSGAPGYRSQTTMMSGKIVLGQATTLRSGDRTSQVVVTMTVRKGSK